MVERRRKANLLVILILSLLVVLIILTSYLAYQNYSMTGEVVKYYDSKLEEYINDSANATQFYDNMRFNHNNITYFILDCDKQKTDRLNSAFLIISNSTEIINFTQIDNENDSDILVGCSKESYQKEESFFVAGEGGPTKFINLDPYPLILKGKISLYEKNSCSYPITELHEIFHVFGFNHVNDSRKIMYPYVNCKQRIDQELINKIKILYSVIPLADVYFEKASIVKNKRYLDINIQVNNKGLIEAENVTLRIYAEGNKIGSFNLKDIGAGVGKEFWATNVLLPSLRIKNVTLVLVSDTREFDEKNNVI